MKTKFRKQSVAQLTTPIKSAITKHIKASTASFRLNQWYCGITNNTTRRNAEHRYKKGAIKHFFAIDAKTLTKARAVEKYFSEKGTVNHKKKGNTVKDTTNVYVFKMPHTPLGSIDTFDAEAYLNGF